MKALVVLAQDDFILRQACALDTMDYYAYDNQEARNMVLVVLHTNLSR